MPRLMAREVLSEGGQLREHMQAQFSTVLSPKTLMLIVAAQRRGEIRDDLNPVLVGLSLISLAVFPFAAAPVWRAVAQSLSMMSPSIGTAVKLLRTSTTSLAQPTDPESLIQHTLALFDSALEPSHANSKR
jgi:hypothetical protein